MSSNNIYKPKLTELEAYQIALNEIQRLKAENELMRNHIKSAETECYVQLGALRVSLEQADKDRDILHAEIEQLKAENEKLKESDRELKEEIKYILHNCQPLSVLSTQEKLHWVTCSINLWSKLK